MSGRKRAPEAELNDAQLIVRLPTSLVERLDAHALRLRQNMPGVPFSRADAVRVLLSSGLDDAEKRKPGRG